MKYVLSRVQEATQIFLYNIAVHIHITSSSGIYCYYYIALNFTGAKQTSEMKIPSFYTTDREQLGQQKHHLQCGGSGSPMHSLK